MRKLGCYAPFARGINSNWKLLLRFLLKNVRVATASLFETDAFGGDDSGYGATFIVPLGHPQLAEIRGAVLTAATEKWGDKAKGILALLRVEGKVPWVEGTSSNKNCDINDGLEGACHLYTRNSGKAPVKPVVLDAQNRPVTQADGIIGSGCFVDASVKFLAQDNADGRRIKCALLGIRSAASLI